ncbi:hypothetical protein BABINDRAFT_159494 [Babjeviella inositovora NRRL Y-12698]|uniref:AMP-dependent synthetase/ligase domain-containing protein n=1 Tax=Babjeviella inositovora NRRL Y-12698 TaxID=984486 RepID=A0A1E3QZF4_9ASCO|nr:uncharacterized protein BABINDRAFT_159494 [Babjeviella inositovora NRRL Y-12698]ODQ83018.1 hypothetical protein BABINDRAFT_159494 [Babjeviella inositovora NRRL Y-12698]
MKLYPPTCAPQINENVQIADALEKFYPLPHPSLTSYFEVPGTENSNGSPVLRSKICANTEGNNMVTTAHPKLTTMYDYMQFALQYHARNKCFGSRKVTDDAYTFKTYREVAQARDNFGSGLIQVIKYLGIENHNFRSNDKEDFILTIFAPNCYEWFITDLSCMAYSITSTSLYSTLGAESYTYILNATKSPVILLTLEKLGPLLKSIHESNLTFVRAMVLFDVISLKDVDPAMLELVKAAKIELWTFSEVLEIGKKRPEEHIPPQPGSIYSIFFTSGTVGNPKGVVLTHQAVVGGLTSIIACMTNIFISRSSKKTRRALCILPITHVFQRLVCFYELTSGATIYLPSNPKDIKQVMADLLLVKPTHLVGVPRIYNRIESAIVAKIEASNWIFRVLFRKCMAYKELQYRAGHPVTDHWLYDRQLTSKIKSSMGLEHMELMVTGSAPMLPETICNLRGWLNSEFLQGYGLTESFGCASVPYAEDEMSPDSSGYLCVAIEMRLVDCPEMNFTWAGNRSGEVVLRGPQITQEYYKDPIITQENFYPDGWLRTGDVGTFDRNGRLNIVDRVKNIFKLSQGEYISPEKVENIYLHFNASLMSQIFVYGDSLQSYLVGILVIDESACLELIQKSRIPSLKTIRYMDESNMDQLNRNAVLRKYILSRINAKVDRSRMLNGLEKLRNIYLFFNNEGKGDERNSTVNFGFTEANGLLTPTLKIKRYAARKFFEIQCKDMYEEGDITSP